MEWFLVALTDRNDIQLHQEYGVQQEPSDNDFPAVSLTHTSRAVEDGSLIGLHSFWYIEKHL